MLYSFIYYFYGGICMKVNVFGTRTYSLTDEKTGEIREGVTVHYTQNPTNAGWKGLEWGKFSVSKDTPMYGAVMALKLPANLDLEFNRYGKVADFEVLD